MWRLEFNWLADGEATVIQFFGYPLHWSVTAVDRSTSAPSSLVRNSGLWVIVAPRGSKALSALVSSTAVDSGRTSIPAQPFHLNRLFLHRSVQSVWTPPSQVIALSGRDLRFYIEFM